MEVIQPAHLSRRPALAPMVGGTVVGTFLVVAGLVLGYVALSTPVLRSVMPEGRLDWGAAGAGILVWTVALVAPAASVVIGAHRLVRILGAARARMPQRSATLRALDALTSDVTVATGIALPDGRAVSELVIGPFGAAVVRELPPSAVTRERDGRWELRTRRGWIPIESPLDRAVRDAERVRRWLAHDDADFVVKVYAAVVGPAPIVERTADCAVLTPDRLAAWIGGLPPQRTLTDGRRDRLLAFVRAAAT